MRARLASANPHKLVELRRALPGWEIELVDDQDFPPEDGTTYAENARGKAVHGRAAAPPDAWVIGEDSGIEAAALGGAPGLASARWADDGVERLLAELAGGADRRARYVCVIVAIGPDAGELRSRGRSRGRSRRAGAEPKASATTRSSCPPGRSAQSPSSATPGRAANSHRARAAAALAAALSR